MKKLELYIKEAELFDTVKQELFESSVEHNKKIDETDDYILYAGNYGDKIKLNDVLKTVKKGFYHIENCYNSNRLKLGDSNSIICITNVKMNPALNVVMFIDSFDENKYHIVIKTVMKKNAFKASLIRTVNEELTDRIIFIEV